MGQSSSKPNKTKKTAAKNPNIATKAARNKTKTACDAMKAACKATKDLDDPKLNKACKKAIADCKDVLS